MNLASVSDLENFLHSPESKVLTEDETRMIESAASGCWTTIGMVLVRRIALERATGPNA